MSITKEEFADKRNQSPIESDIEFVPERIRLLRKRDRITLEELSARVGISRTSLQKIETRRQTMDASEIGIIASYFGVSVSFFYKGESSYMAYLPVKDVPHDEDYDIYEYVAVPWDASTKAFVGIVNGEARILDEAGKPEEGQSYTVVIGKKAYAACRYDGKNSSGRRFICEGRKLYCHPNKSGETIYRDYDLAVTPFE